MSEDKDLNPKSQISNPKSDMDEEETEATEVEDYQAKWLRAVADYQNLKKQHDKDREEWIKYANAGLLLELLPVISHFKEAMKHIPEHEKSVDWVVGVQQIKKQFDEFLAKLGVSEIPTVGQQFDPQLHEAVGQQTDEQKADDEILVEVQPGYFLNEKVIEPAKVIVNKHS